MYNRSVLGVAGEDVVVEVFAPGDASRSGLPATVRLTSVMQVCPSAVFKTQSWPLLPMHACLLPMFFCEGWQVLL